MSMESFSRLLKNPPFTLRQAQGERSRHCNRWRFAVRAEPVEARKRLFQHPARGNDVGIIDERAKQDLLGLRHWVKKLLDLANEILANVQYSEEDHLGFMALCFLGKQ